MALKVPPTLVTDFSDSTIFTKSENLVGGVSTTLTSTTTGNAKGSASLKMEIAGGSVETGNSYVEARFNCNLTPSQSRRFCLRIYNEDITEDSDAQATTQYHIQIRVSNTSGDVTTTAARTGSLQNTNAKQRVHTLVLHQTDFTTDIGGGVDWGDNIRSISIRMTKKSGDAGDVSCTLDCLYSGWELDRVPILWSMDDGGEPDATHGQYEYLWKTIFEPRGWLFTLCTTQNLIDTSDRLTVKQLQDMHSQGNDIIYHGVDHVDHRLTGEGGTYANEAAILADIQAWQAWAATNKITRTRDEVWAAFPTNAYSATTLSAMADAGITRNRAGQGHTTANQYYSLSFDNDANHALLLKELTSIATSQLTAAQIIAYVDDAVLKQAPLSFFGHKFVDVDASPDMLLTEAELLWPLLDAMEESGQIRMGQLTDHEYMVGAFHVPGNYNVRSLTRVGATNGNVASAHSG